MKGDKEKIYTYKYLIHTCIKNNFFTMQGYVLLYHDEFEFHQ